MTELKVYFQHLLMYDYVAFGFAFVLFIMLVVLSIFMRHKIVVLLFLSLLAIGTLFALPVYAKMMIDKKIRPVNVSLESYKNLIFAKTMIVFVNFENQGKVDLSECAVKIKVIKNTESTVKKYINALKPKLTHTQKVKGLVKGESTQARVVINGFNLKETQHLDVSGYCY